MLHGFSVKGNVSVSIPFPSEGSLTLPRCWDFSAGVESFMETLQINVRVQRQALSSPPSQCAHVRLRLEQNSNYPPPTMAFLFGRSVTAGLHLQDLSGKVCVHT